MCCRLLNVGLSPVAISYAHSTLHDDTQQSADQWGGARAYTV